MNPDIVEIKEYLVLDSIDDLEYPPLCLLTKSNLSYFNVAC